MLARSAQQGGGLLFAALLVLAGCSDASFGVNEFASEAPSFSVAGHPPTRPNPQYLRGLEAWRKPGNIQDGAACANCHAPDAIDLAFAGFDDDTIRRRTAPHLSGRDIEAIIGLVNIHRNQYDLPVRSDAADFRPFQPGGEVLAGATITERDLSFARHLETRGFRYATQPVLTLQDAVAARDEWLATNPRTLKIGIPFNRWSEDPHNGDEHASLADWLPDFPRLPLAGQSEALYALHDAYLAEPTDDTFWAILEATDDLTETFSFADGYPEATELMLEKYRSVLVAQHMFRAEVRGDAGLTDRGPVAFAGKMRKGKGPNGVWMVADFARRKKHGTFEIPPSLATRISPNSSLKDEMTRLRVPWFWAGWYFDLGLQHSHASNSTKSAEYMTHHTWIDGGPQWPRAEGYAVHNAWAITRKLIGHNFDGVARDPASRGMELAYSNFHGYGRAWKWEPQDAERQQRYRLLVENSYRMMMHLLQEDIRAYGVRRADHWLGNLAHMEDFFDHAQTEHYTFNLALLADTRALINGEDKRKRRVGIGRRG